MAHAPAPIVLVCLLTACGEKTPPDAAGGGAGAPAAGTASGGSATSGAGGVGPSGGVGIAPGGAGAGGSAGTVSAGAGGTGGAGGAAGNAGSCPPSAVVCDDFEKYPDGATDLSPDWIAYTYSGAVKVDTTKPRGGAQSLHLTVEQGMRRYADIIRETPGQELLPRKHYGRFMVWLTQVPTGAQHWNLNGSTGPMTGFPEENAKYAEGGMFGKLMSNYAQRALVMVDGEYPIRGIGPENGDPAVEADCAVAAPNQTIEAGKWVCWEWEFDGTTDSAFLWLDGMAMTEIDAVQSGKQCQGPGFNGKPMSASYRWESPQVWDKLVVGWEQYQDMPAQELWIDDLVVGPDRVGCPAP